MASNATKKNFELRMSKKVAELTQVVHMLFMRNHEKELELEAVKDAYEYEIYLVIADASAQMEELNEQLHGKEQQLLRKLQEEYQNQNKEDQKKIQVLENNLKEEVTECQSIRDLLILSEKDIETLCTLNAEELLKHNAEMSEKSKEIDQLKVHLTDLERLANYKESQNLQVLDLQKKSVEKLQKEALQLREELHNSENLREMLTIRNKNLEDDVKSLKQELVRRVSLPDVEDSKKQSLSVNTESFFRKPNYEREIHRLKLEIQRYRMELSNREANFNWRFAETQPIILNQRPTSGIHSIKEREMPIGYSTFLRSVSLSDHENALNERGVREVMQRYSEGMKNTSVLSSSDSSSMVRQALSSTNERLPKLDSKLPISRPHLAKPQPSKLLKSKKYH